MLVVRLERNMRSRSSSMVASVGVVGISHDALLVRVQCLLPNELALLGPTFADPSPHLGVNDEHSTMQSFAELA